MVMDKASMSQYRIDFLNNRKFELLRIDKEQGYLWNKQRYELEYVLRCLKISFNKQKAPKS